MKIESWPYDDPPRVVVTRTTISRSLARDIEDGRLSWAEVRAIAEGMAERKRQRALQPTSDGEVEIMIGVNWWGLLLLCAGVVAVGVAAMFVAAHTVIPALGWLVRTWGAR